MKIKSGQCEIERHLTVRKHIAMNAVPLHFTLTNPFTVSVKFVHWKYFLHYLHAFSPFFGSGGNITWYPLLRSHLILHQTWNDLVFSVLNAFIVVMVLVHYCIILTPSHNNLDYNSKYVTVFMLLLVLLPYLIPVVCLLVSLLQRLMMQIWFFPNFLFIHITA